MPTSIPDLSYSEAKAAIPQELRDYIMITMAQRESFGSRVHDQVQLLLYLLGSLVLGRLAEDGVPETVKAFYRVSKQPPEAGWPHKYENHPGKKLADRLQDSLRKDHTAHPEEAIFVEFDTDGLRVHGVDLTRRERNEHGGFQHFKDDDEAMAYVIESLPNLRGLRDTHFRSERGFRTYSEETVERLRTGLAEFFRREVLAVILAGSVTDQNYVTAWSAAAADHPSRFRVCHVYPEVPFNVMILDFNDERPSEVLFGWGRQDNVMKNRPVEGVFKTAHSNLVEQFSTMFDRLIDRSARSTTIGPAARNLWRPYLEDDPSKKRILFYGEPLFWRDKNHTLFWRSTGINDSEGEGVARMLVSRDGQFCAPCSTFLNSGEMQCVLNLMRWFADQRVVFNVQQKGHGDKPNDLSGEDREAFGIVLGSPRVNRFINSYQRHRSFVFRIGDREDSEQPGTVYGVLGRKSRDQPPSDEEEFDLVYRDHPKGSDTMAYVLVSRRRGLVARGTSVTLISAHIGRAIEGVGRYLTSEEHVLALAQKLQLEDGAWPEEFQLVFEVLLTDDETVSEVQGLVDSWPWGRCESAG